MSDREGVSPAGGAPDRSPPESADSASADGRAPNGSAPNGSAEARGAREVAAASLFDGWKLPLTVAAIVIGLLGQRREEEGRTLAFVGIGTGIAGLVFAAVWIGYYAIVFGALPH